MIHEGDNLEGWVQAKVTKAADYIASVYHFMEYEMKKSEYGDALENAEMYSESVRRVFQQKLMEAKKKAQEVKDRAAKDEAVEEGFPTVADAKARHEKEKGTGKFDKKKISTGTVYTRKAEKDIEQDDEDTPKKSKKVKEGFPTVADAKARHEKEKGTGKFDKKKISTGTVYTRKADKDVEQDDDAPKSKKVKEAAKPDFLDMDKDGNKKEPMKKAVADKNKKVKEAKKSEPYKPDPRYTKPKTASTLREPSADEVKKGHAEYEKKYGKTKHWAETPHADSYKKVKESSVVKSVKR
jgi:hypothetical protein